MKGSERYRTFIHLVLYLAIFIKEAIRSKLNDFSLSNISAHVTK